jgi:hypothetical protein
VSGIKFSASTIRPHDLVKKDIFDSAQYHFQSGGTISMGIQNLLGAAESRDSNSRPGDNPPLLTSCIFHIIAQNHNPGFPFQRMVTSVVGDFWSYDIQCPTSNVAQENLVIKINFNILNSFSSSDILTIYLHAFLQSLYPLEKNFVQGLPRDLRQNNPNTNKKFRWSFSVISHQLSCDVAKKEKSEGAKSGE